MTLVRGVAGEHGLSGMMRVVLVGSGCCRSSPGSS